MANEAVKNLNLFGALVRSGNLKALLAGLDKKDENSKEGTSEGGGHNGRGLSPPPGLAAAGSFSPASSSSGSTGKLVKELSSLANVVVGKCARILHLTAEELRLHFEHEASMAAKDPSRYARNLLEYCCFRALAVSTQVSDALKDKELRRLTFDMMLAWETPGAGHRPVSKAEPILETDEEESVHHGFFAGLFPLLVDVESAVSREAFVRIAPHVSIAADSITVHSQFDVLTSESGGRLPFVIYDKYLQELDKAVRQIKSQTTASVKSALGLTSGEETVIEIDGTTTAPVLQHVGVTAWPGRLTLTDHALYFEAYNVVYYDKAKKFDLSADVKHKVKPDLTGPLGARLFDKAVAYSTTLLSEPVVFEFPELTGHSRRDYWLAIIREIVAVHLFVRSHKLEGPARAQALAKSVLGIARMKAVWAVLRILPARPKMLLTFIATDELPGGDRILEALAESLRLEAPCYAGRASTPTEGSAESGAESPSDSSSASSDAGGSGAGSVGSSSKGTEGQSGVSRIRRLSTSLEKSSAVAAVASLLPVAGVPRTGVGGSPSGDGSPVMVGEVLVGEMTALEKAIASSLDNSKILEKAKASVNEARVEGIGTNKALLEELLLPLFAIFRWLHSLTEWHEPSKSFVFLFTVIYIIARDWLRFVIPAILVTNAGLVLWLRYLRRFDVKPGSRPNEVVVTLPKGQSKVEQLLELQNALAGVEHAIQTANISLLKTRALFLSEQKTATDQALLFLVAGAVFLLIVPFRWMVLLLVLETFTRKLEIREEAIRRWMRRLRDWWHSIPVVPVRFVEAQGSASD